MKTKILSFLFLCLIISCISEKNKLQVASLKCENLTNPSGIDKTLPRFSWKIKSERNGTSQAAYQILVASELHLLDEKNADFWNSQKTESESSIWVNYAGAKLSPGMSAYWKVRVWDEDGNISKWSEPAKFGIGLLNNTDWKARYIGFNTENGFLECPQLYKSFNMENTDGKMILHVNSLGYHEVYLNGKKVGEGVLTPAVSQFTKRSLENTYDVSSYIKKGQNNLMIWLGSGWYTEGLPGVANNGPVVKAQLEKVSQKKREIVLATDESWKGRASSYTRIGDWRAHHFGGEIVDGRLTKTDLLLDENEGRKWAPVSLVDIPEHAVTPQMAELNKKQKTFTPIEIEKTGQDTFLVDMGTNLTGWVEMHFSNLEEAQNIKLEYCDHLEEGKFYDRNFLDEYIAAGKAPEIFENKFNYHAFRYIQVTGLHEIPAKDSIKAFLIHADYELASGFECSDSDLNQIHDMLFYTLRCLSIGGDLVDCPHMERLGYGGDGNASTVTVQTMFNMGPVYENWLQAWGDCMREDGGMPHTAPNPYSAGGGPYWCGFIITASWNTYLNYGDTSLLEKYYPFMQKWLGYAEKYSVDGLLKRWPDTDYRGWFLGDWAVPDGIDQKAEASVDVVNNSFLAECYEDMQKIAQTLGKTDDVSLYASKTKQLQNRIHEVYFNSDNNTYGTGTQIDLAFPMNVGVVPENLQTKVKQAFYNETEINRNGHLACGLVGLPVVTEWVVKNQAADLMYSMLTKRDYPGYLYMIDNGATTTWEHWNGERSRIHNCYNGTGSWFYQAVGGIRPEEDAPAYRKVRIQPQIPEGVTWAKTFKETPFGKLVVDWKIENQQMEMALEIPIGMEAELVLPENTKEYIINGKNVVLQNESQLSILLNSGKYAVEY